MEPFSAASFPRARVLEGRTSRTFIGYVEPKPGMETINGETVIEVKDGVIVIGRVFRDRFGRKDKTQAPTNLHEVQEIAITMTTAKQNGFVDGARIAAPRRSVWVVRKSETFHYVSHEMAEDRAASGRWAVGGTRVDTPEVGVFPFSKTITEKEEDAVREAVWLNREWASAINLKVEEQDRRLAELIGATS